MSRVFHMPGNSTRSETRHHGKKVPDEEIPEEADETDDYPPSETSSSTGYTEAEHLIVPSHERSILNDRTIVLNVRGQCFITKPSILKSIPGTRLATLVNDPNFEESCEVFYNKDPIMFRYIMDLYKDHELHIPKDKCVVTIKEDLEYWAIDESFISVCCRKRYFEGFNALKKTARIKRELISLTEDCMANMTGSPRRQKLAIFLCKANSSFAAKIWSYIFMMMIFISVGLIFCSTHPNFRVPLATSIPNQVNEHAASKNKQMSFILNTEQHDGIILVELICCIYFSVELLLRTIAYSSNIRRMISLSTVCDIIYLIPAWITIAIYNVDTTSWFGDHSARLKLSIHVLSILRVTHLQRLVEHNHELTVLWFALKSSRREVTLMMVLVLSVGVMSTSLLFITNLFIDSSIDNMFMGLWWAVVTITTVGYGDQYPQSWIGYIVACICTLTGVIVTGMSIPLITKRFHVYYQTRLPQAKGPHPDTKQDVMDRNTPLSMNKIKPEH